MDRTEKASRVAAGALLRVTRDVWHERRPSFQYGFVLAKPPSHHSTPNEQFLRYKGLYDLDGLGPGLRAAVEAGRAVPNGFCHLNSMASAVAYLLNLPAGGGEPSAPRRPRKVVIFDIDVHLGDGTESMFWSNPDVHHVDIHEDASDLTEERDATLTGDPALAPDSNLSILIEDIEYPICPEPAADSIRRYKCAVRGAIPTVAAWMGQPGAGGDIPVAGADAPVDVMFFVSAGFDAMAHDGFGTQHLDAAWYRWFVLTLRKRFPRVPIVFNLEGGYNAANVVDGVRTILESLSVSQGSAEWQRDCYA